MFDPEAAVAFLRDRDPAKLPKWRQTQMSVPDRFGFGAGGTQNWVDQLCPSTSCLQAKPAMAAGVRDGSRHGPTRPMPRSARIVTERLVFRLVARDCRPSVCPIHRARRQRSEPSSLEKNRTQLVCLDVPAERRTCARAGGVVEARQDHRPEGRTRGDSRSARADSPNRARAREATCSRRDRHSETSPVGPVVFEVRRTPGPDKLSRYDQGIESSHGIVVCRHWLDQCCSVGAVELG